MTKPAPAVDAGEYIAIIEYVSRNLFPSVSALKSFVD